MPAMQPQRCPLQYQERKMVRVEPTVQQEAPPGRAAARPKDQAGLGPVLTLTALHTINDFYGLVLPPLLPLLR
ncbi:MAG: hypothetical protein C4289_11155, partial [Chloroflexota bacterium]